MNTILPSIDLYHCHVFSLVHLKGRPSLGIYTVKEQKQWSKFILPFNLYKSRVIEVGNRE